MCLEPQVLSSHLELGSSSSARDAESSSSLHIQEPRSSTCAYPSCWHYKTFRHGQLDSRSGNEAQYPHRKLPSNHPNHPNHGNCSRPGKRTYCTVRADVRLQGSLAHCCSPSLLSGDDDTDSLRRKSLSRTTTPASHPTCSPQGIRECYKPGCEWLNCLGRLSRRGLILCQHCDSGRTPRYRKV